MSLLFYEESSKGGKKMSEELAYSIHLGSDKNKTTKAKEIAKNNQSGSTSFSNNGIQNAKQLSKVNKHNLRDYDKNKENICVIYGTENLYQDVIDLYQYEFEEVRIEYNEKQTCEDRKIDDYFKHISQDKQKDLVCEFIIELGDMDFWNDKNMHYRQGMIQVYKEQVQDLMRIVPEFKIANAVIHFDEVSPHMHLVGVPIKDDYKRGMRKQPAKSKVFTKESLTKLQDEMRSCCIKSYNKVYSEHSLLKQKQRGRNRDINVKDMDGYADIKRNIEKKTQKLAEANKQTKTLDNESNDIKEILTNLKPSKLNSKIIPGKLTSPHDETSKNKSQIKLFFKNKQELKVNAIAETTTPTSAVCRELLRIASIRIMPAIIPLTINDLYLCLIP